MCKYCFKNFQERKDYTLIPDNGYDYDKNIGIEIKKIILQTDGTATIIFSDNKRLDENNGPIELAMAYRIPFDYCPFCGRKLED